MTGDTPPARLGCAVLVAEIDLLRASRVKFDTLSHWCRHLPSCAELKPVSGCAGGSRCGVCWRSWTAFFALIEALSEPGLAI